MAHERPSRPTTVVLVEDRADEAAIIMGGLESTRYAVVWAATCAEGWKKINLLKPDLAILDVSLPDDSGFNLCRRIRSHAVLFPMPIILLTGKVLMEDKVQGFDAGADQYLVKPVQIEELCLWVRALLRRIQYAQEHGGVLRLEDFTIDPQSHTVIGAKTRIADLTHKEFDLLYELARHRPKVLSTDVLLSSVWGERLHSNTVEVHIRRIRAKLGIDAGRIVTVAGVGYRFE